jgi:hypothetical protein
VALVVLRNRRRDVLRSLRHSTVSLVAQEETIAARASFPRAT